MPLRTVPILVDTNVIIESHRAGCWNALTSGFQVETVWDCAVETQTGSQRRRPDQQIGADSLKRLANIASVSDADRAVALVRDSHITFLDDGERCLWAHALSRSDAWVLCGPDTASMRLGVRLGLRDQLVSLEALLHDIGHRPKLPLRDNYTARWLAECLNKLTLLEGGKPP
jgi:hypothetical protein